MMDLKPCPFCGGEANVIKSDLSTLSGRNGAGFRVICSPCEIGTFIFSKPDSAAKRWNRRASHA